MAHFMNMAAKSSLMLIQKLRLTTQLSRLMSTGKDKRFTCAIDVKEFKPPVSYQADVGLDNLKEITDMIQRDPKLPNNQYNSYPILAAFTAFSDRPWYTARDSNGTLVGFVMGSRVGDTYTCMGNLYVASEARGHNVAENLMRASSSAIANEFPKSILLGRPNTAGVRSLEKTWGDLHYNEDGAFCIRFGIPSYDGTLLPEKCDGVNIVVATRGQLFDKLLAWDTWRVHQIPRKEFLKVLLFSSLNVHTYVAVDESSGDVVGYGCIQPALDNTCMIIGPLYAEEDGVALVILRKVMTHYVEGRSVMLTHYVHNEVMRQVFDDMKVSDLVTIPCVTAGVDSPFPTELRKQMYLSSSNAIMIQ